MKGDLKISKKNDSENYVDEHKHERFVSNKHFLHDIIILNPLSIQYKKYWKEIKRRCMEGYWHEGKWMPGNLYFYVNFCKIKLNKDNFTTTKTLGRPFLRDLEWEKAYVLAEARGFSGFADDEDYTCLEDVGEIEKLKGDSLKTWKEDYILPKQAFKKNGELKKYKRARYYMREIHTRNLGKPLFQNRAYNTIDIECRGGGKDLIYSTLLHYKDGSKRPISEVKVGDIIIGGDGKHTVVEERVDFNDQMQYEITFATGRKVTCGGGHLWTVFFRGKKITLSLDEIRKSYYWERSNGVKDFKYAIPTLARREKDKIIDIRAVGIHPSVCIGVDNKDHLFLVDDYVVTHNSYWGANGMILHNFYFDGCYDYDDYWENLQRKEPSTSETLVGAIDTAYSKDLLEKVQVGMDEIGGQQIFQGRTIPSPLSKSYSGSWYSGKQFIIAKVDKKINGTWRRVGSGSIVHHRSFKDDPFAGNGTRPSLTCLEEVGFMKNLPDALGAMKDTTYDGPIKFGTIYMFGTGGNMKGGDSEGARDVFIDPGAYDCLKFEDVWEDTGDIGFFVPYELGLNKFKNEEGVTNLVQATKFVDGVRDRLKKGKSKQPLYSEMQNNPRAPSEAFLTVSSNVFPVAELKDHLGWLKSMEQDAIVKGQYGELIWQQDDGADKARLKWIPDLNDKLIPCGYRMKKGDDTTGCIQIWEHPKQFNGEIPYGLYISGCDPYDQDQSVSTASLGSTIIYKTFYTADGLYEWPVAEYTARPGTAAEHHENVRKLLIYYNAACLYENERNTIKMHFEHKHSLYLLAKTPTILKATEGSKVDRQYGIHMTIQIKNELEIYTRDWLTQDAGDGKLNLHKIYSIPLIQELINYNHEGNFDRVIAFMLTICHRLMNYHLKVDNIKQEQEDNFDPFFQRAFTGKFYT